MDERPEQRPEGRLLAMALKRTQLSQRKAAAMSGLSEGHWRAIVSGSRSMGSGSWVPVRGPAETLARMAQVVGVTPRQLIDVGREDAAEELDQLFAAEAAEPEPEFGEFEEGSIRRRVEELIRRRKLRQLDRALSLIEDQDHRDAG